MNLTLKRSLFNPFEFISDYKALLIGLAAMLLTAVAGYFNSVHLDGPIDLHIGMEAPFHIYLIEAALDWLVLSLLLYAAGLLVSSSSIRFIDILGMQSMARWPLLIAVLSSFLAPMDDLNKYIEWKLLQSGEPVELGAGAMIMIALSMIITLACIVWMIALMYKAYSISCNIKGAKAIITFIIALLLSTVLVKLALSYVFDAVILPGKV
jgi:hypothetical protein